MTLGDVLPPGAIGRNDTLLWSLVAGVFLLFVLLAAAVPVVYIGLSLFAYLVYALDKSAERRSCRGFLRRDAGLPET